MNGVVFTNLAESNVFQDQLLTNSQRKGMKGGDTTYENTGKIQRNNRCTLA